MIEDRALLREFRLNGLALPRNPTRPRWKAFLSSPWLWGTLVLLLLYLTCAYVMLLQVTSDIEVTGGTVPGISLRVLRRCAGLALPTLLLWTANYVLADRYRPQRLLVWSLAIGWGATVAVTFSYFINSWAAGLMEVFGDNDPTASARAAIYSAPFVEEAAKASAIFLLAVVMRNRLTSRLSAIVVGGLSAIGFAFTENVVYYSRVLEYGSRTTGAGDVEAYLQQLVYQRGFQTSFAHPLFTIMTGIGIGIAIRTHSKLVRILAPLVGYLVAALLHMFYNATASVMPETRWYVIYLTVLLPLGSLGQIYLFRQISLQGITLENRLTDYVAMGWLRPSDVPGSSRWWRRAVALLKSVTHGWTCLTSTWRVQNALTELAYLRDAETRGIVDEIARLRARVLVSFVHQERATAIINHKDHTFRIPTIRQIWRWVIARATGRPLDLTVLGRSGHSDGSAEVGSLTYAAVDPRWGPPK